MIEFQQVIERLEAHGYMKSVVKGNRFRSLLAPYRTKMIYHTGEWGRAGHDSFRTLLTVDAFGNNGNDVPAVTLGNFVECGRGCRILIGGEHHNQAIINNALIHWNDVKQELLVQGITTEECFSKGLVEIGSNVLISQGAMILSGVKIGDGAVIGAGSVVAKDVPPFAIMGGNPAKVLKYRFDEEVVEDLLKIRWWDFNIEAFVEHFADIQKLEQRGIREKLLELAPMLHDTTEQYFVFRNDSNNPVVEDISLVGVEIEGKFIAPQQFPEELRFFMSQMKQPETEPVYFIKDIFSFAGLVEEKEPSVA